MPGPHAALVGITDPLAVPGLDFAARVLAAVCDSITDRFDSVGGGLLVDYARLPDALFTQILPHFGIVPDPAERAAIERVLGRDAKAPGQRFDPASRKARADVSDEVLAASARHLAPALARLRARDPDAAD